MKFWKLLCRKMRQCNRCKYLQGPENGIVWRIYDLIEGPHHIWSRIQNVHNCNFSLVRCNLARNQTVWFWMFVNAYPTSLLAFCCWVWPPTCHWLICIPGAQALLAFPERSAARIIDHWYMNYVYPNLLSMIHVMEWNIMIISKIQVWWVTDWTTRSMDL